jgi:phosphate starvation-inducible membrane PsiE
MTAVLDRSAGTIETLPVEAKHPSVGRRCARVVPYAMLPVALALWLASLPRVDMRRIGDYGLIPLLPLTFWVALAMVLIGFSILVRRAATPTPLLAGHVLALIAILHATPCLVYETLRYPWAWRHVAVVDYFLRHDGVDKSIQHLPAYQFWPAFFNVNAMLDQASGLETSLSYAAWAPPFFNVLLIGPLFLIFSTFTADRRLVWSAIVIFFLGSWVGQDYFSPQACAYFLYLTAVALCLRYLGRHGEVPRRHRRLVAVLAIAPMLAAIVPTHQLTPVMVICGLGMLGVCCRQRVWLLTLLMVGLTIGWDLLFAGPFFTSNETGIMSSFGSIGSNVKHASTSVQLAAPTHSQALLAQLDKAHSAAVWVLAFVGFSRRLRGRQFRGRSELALPVLAVTPALMTLTNDYGGEMIFRAYLFGLPFIAFYAAAAFFPRETPGCASGRHERQRMPQVTRLALPIVLLLLVPGFIAGYYGREQVNYLSPQEFSAVRFLVGIAPRGSLIIGTSNGLPVEHVNFEFYDYLSFASYEPQDRQAILKDPVGMFSDIMTPKRHHHAFLMISRVDVGAVETIGALPPGALAGIVDALTLSPRFTVIYRNSDAVIITLTQPVPEGVA